MQGMIAALHPAQNTVMHRRMPGSRQQDKLRGGKQQEQGRGFTWLQPGNPEGHEGQHHLP